MSHRNRTAFPWTLHIASRAATALLLLMSLLVFPSAEAPAKDTKQNTKVSCTVTDGQGMKQFADEKDSRFVRWVLERDGVKIGDDISFNWEPQSAIGPSLKVALDNPVTKQAQIISITGDTVSAVVTTSDSATTRSWLFTINFRLKKVMASGFSSNSAALKGQMMTLSCQFEKGRG